MSIDGRVLVLNCGSSSVKFRLFDGERTIDKGLIERIGEPDGDARSHRDAISQILAKQHAGDLTAVGHRVVHGGTLFQQPTLIDDAVIAAIRDLIPLAPLHNPANLTGISVARALLPATAQVAIFDTAFHSTLPTSTSTYAIDVATARKYGVRRYGFHGTSHSYVSRVTATLLNRPLQDVNIITLHLGNGASACAVRGGRSIATSMGLSPLEGLVMGTRSGDIDPAVVFHLHRVAGMSIDDIDYLLNQRGGLRGLCGDNDMRTVLARRASGDQEAADAFDVYCSRIKSYVGAYAAQLGQLDAIAFTAGVGENSPAVRAASLSHLDVLGVRLDERRNDPPSAGRGARLISSADSKVAVFVVPTDEEFEIATQTRHVLASSDS